MSNFELILVDDGSHDKTWNWLHNRTCHDPRVKLFQLKRNMGIAPALNHGIRQCTNELIAHHDIDDYSALDRFELQLKYMNDNPDVALAGTGMYLVDSRNRMLGATKKPMGYQNLREIIKNGCPFAHGSVIFRKSILWDKEGGYDESDEYKYAEDYELWVRMVANYRCENMPEILYTHRDHPNKVSIKFGDKQSRATDRIIVKARKLIP